VKEVLGVCVSMGVTVEGKESKDVQKEIDKGAYDDLFKE
jgi:large subunit ribosomal protein L11